MIPAGFVIIHQTAVEVDAEIFIRIFLDLELPFFAILFSNHNDDIFVIRQKAVVKNIFDLPVVDRQQHIARLDLHLFCNTARLYAPDHMSLF